MHPRRSLAALFVPLLALCANLFCVSASAATIQVPSTNTPTIQSGIDAAQTGDTVLVAPGTYYENIDFKGKAITVTSSGGAASTIIDGGGNGPAVTFKSSETASSILSNLTIQHGGNFETFNGTQYIFAAGGIQVTEASPTILNNVITLNTCWGIRLNGSGSLIQGNEISATQDPHGDCSFGGGSGIYVGGDLQLPFPSGVDVPPTILGNTIENNVESGLEIAGGNGGAAITIWGGSPLIENNILRNNSSPGGSGGAINDYLGQNVVIAQNLIYGNSAGCGGGALALNQITVEGPTSLLVANNTIANNTGVSAANDSECTSISQIYPDTDSYGEGGPAGVIVNNIISGSTSYPAVNCDWFDAPSEWHQLTFDHNLLYNAGGPFFGSYCVDVSAKYGNVSADPHFINPSTGDFHLSSNSPAIDAGNNSALLLFEMLSGKQLLKDFDANPRVQDATAKGYPVIDMGAYEFTGAVETAPTSIVLTSSAYTGNAGNNYVLTATLAATTAGIPPGTVTFYMDGSPIGTSGITAAGAGIATLSGFAMTPGVHSLYASYPGQGSFPPATSPIILVNINLYSTSLSLRSSADPSLLGQSVTFTVTASSSDPNYIPTPITLTDIITNTTLTTLNPSSSTGIATYTTSSLVLGLHLISAAYAGDSQHAGDSFSLFHQVISGYSTTTSLASSQNPASYGQSVTFTATVANTYTIPGSPTGSVTFTDGTTVLGSQPLTGTGPNSAAAILNISTLSVGTHSILATYVPSGVFAASSGGLQQLITGLATSTVLSSSLTPAKALQPVTFTATVTSGSSSAPPTGSVTFSDGANVLGIQPLTAAGPNSAIASLTASTLSAGSHTITATYLPTGGFAASSGQFAETINALPTTTTLTGGPNPAFFGTIVTFPATVTGSATVPTGTVTFYDGATMLTTAPLDASGHAPFTASSLAVGTHSLTAVYSGSSIYAPSTSAPFTEVIQPLPQDFSIKLTSSTTSLKAQHHTTTTLTLASINGFADSLAISCANLPQYVTCTPTPNPAALAANGTATVSLYLDTDSVLGYAHLTPPALPQKHSAPISLALLLSPLSLLALTRKSRRRVSIRLLMLLLALLPISLALSGCGEIIVPYDPPPFATPGTYTIPITATGAVSHISHAANLTLTITP